MYYEKPDMKVTRIREDVRTTDYLPLVSGDNTENDPFTPEVDMGGGD